MAKEEKPTKFKTKKHLARQQREAKQTRIIVIITIVIGAIIVGLLGYGLIDQLIVRPRTRIAQVGDTPIRVKEFETQTQYTRAQMLNSLYQYYLYYQQFGEYGTSFLQTAQSIALELTQPIEVGRNVLNEMIDGILIREAADEKGISVSEEEINEAIQAAFGFFPNGTPTPTQTATIVSTPTLSETQLSLVTLTFTPTEPEAPTETPELPSTPADETDAEGEESESPAEDSEATTENEGSETTGEEETNATPTVQASPTITLTPTPYTTKIYAENLKEFNDAYSLYKFDTNDLRELFEIELLREKLIEEIITEVEPFEEQVWARHILVETEEEANEVLTKLEEGEDFVVLTAKYSTDDSNKEKGGDLGWFNNETMVAEFSEAAFSLDIGEISDPVETSFGFHIIQVLGKRDSQLTESEFLQKKAEAFATWLSEQRDTREDIQIFDNWEEFVPNKPEVPQELLTELYSQ